VCGGDYTLASGQSIVVFVMVRNILNFELVNSLPLNESDTLGDTLARCGSLVLTLLKVYINQ